jgi:hypothetical protein
MIKHNKSTDFIGRAGSEGRHDLPDGDVPRGPRGLESIVCTRVLPEYEKRGDVYIPFHQGKAFEVICIPYRWKKNVDVDETIVVIKNCLDNDPELPGWLVGTINGAIADSEPRFTKYFFNEVKKYAPSALKFFEIPR